MSVLNQEDILRYGFDEYREFINPLVSQRAKLAMEPIHLLRVGVDGVPRTGDGDVVEDFHGTQVFGHRRAEITQALQEFLSSDYLSWYPSRVSPFGGRLARMLCERVGYYDNVFFGCTGSDGVEAGLKLARALTRRRRVIGLEGGYHGCTYGSLSLMQRGYLRDPFGPHLEGAESIPFNDVDALHRAMGDDVAAVLVEPIQGEGGVRGLSGEFIEALCDLTRRHGALLIADEVQTGLGRTGLGMVATANWPRRPDIVVLAKHLGGGLMPMSAMLTRRDFFMRAYGQDFASGESHNATFSTNALAMVAGIATLELLTDEMIARVARVGEKFKRDLGAALGGSELFEEVRGQGLMMGVKLREIAHPWLSFEHFGYEGLEGKSVMSPLLCNRLYKRGFFCFTCGHDWSLFRLQPRYEIPEATLARFVEVCAQELRALEALA